MAKSNLLNSAAVSATEELIQLRHNLHREAELSGYEKNTAAILLDFLNRNNSDNLITKVAGHGIIAVYKGQFPGRTILLRCDMDAVPVNEDMDLPYRSINRGVSHKCGHDGHMAIMAGVAAELCKKRPSRGTVLLLFQPSEETGTGALGVISELTYKPDFCYAMHNLPGFTKSIVITGKGSFACASKGLAINLTGISSHAAEPLKGISPAEAVASLISYFKQVSQNALGIMATLIHVKIGEIAFGTCPSSATVMATLRAPCEIEMQILCETILRETGRIAERENLRVETVWTEEFPATENAAVPVEIIREAACYLGMQTITIEKPFPWSEDFGYFTEKFPGALFGIGAGLNTAPLHHPLYDFPDELISDGVKLFIEIAERTLEC
jgi:amidohydrolase